LQKGEIEEDSWKKNIVKEEIEESGNRQWQKKGKYKEKKKIDWRKGVEKFKKKREKEKQVKEDKWKELDNVKDIGKRMDRFWNAVEEKEIEREYQDVSLEKKP